MTPQVITTAALVNDANGIFEDQTLVGAGALTLNGILVSGGVGYIYGAANTTRQGQRISIEGTGNNSGITATIVGTGPGGDALTEVLTLANNGTATSVYYYRTITSITVSGAVTGNIEGGPLSTNGATTQEFYMDRQQLPGNASLTVSITGTLTYSVEFSVTVRDPQSAANYAQNAIWLPVDNMSALTASDYTSLDTPVVATRLRVSAFTSGTATFTAIQGNPY